MVSAFILIEGQQVNAEGRYYSAFSVFSLYRVNIHTICHSDFLFYDESLENI